MRTLLIAAMILTGLTVTAQKYSIDKAGKITKETTTTKQKDSIIGTVKGDTVKFYRGTNGGVYYWRMSKKTGKIYKSYLKQAK